MFRLIILLLIVATGTGPSSGQTDSDRAGCARTTSFGACPCAYSRPHGYLARAGLYRRYHCSAFHRVAHASRPRAGGDRVPEVSSPRARTPGARAGRAFAKNAPSTEAAATPPRAALTRAPLRACAQSRPRRERTLTRFSTE